jgi:hypothetical protein
MGLSEVTGLTGEQYLKANGIGEKFSKEVIQARYVITELGTFRVVDKNSWLTWVQYKSQLCV